MCKIFRVFIFLIELFVAYMFAVFIKIFRPSMRNVWIISERGDDARDNGYFFYKYMTDKHPTQKILFVISKNSADYKKVGSIGKTVEYNSFRHYLFYALACVRISSNAWGGDLPRTDYFQKLKFLLGKKKKFCCLQHGITKDYMPELFASNLKVDLLICGAKPEFDYINGYFGHSEGVVQYTGFARFDNLHNLKCKNQILIMPTFRKWIKTEKDGEDFFNCWNKILNSKKLIDYLDKTNYEIIFYPHYMIQKYINCFESLSGKIHIASFDRYDVQKLLKESKLLVTDFSSVFFDFAYMNKPMIYYQFDRERYIKEHYDFTKGYFNYDTMGFGPIIFSEDKLIDQIIQYIKNDMHVDKTYQQRISGFFPLKDTHNCDRIFSAISNMIK